MQGGCRGVLLLKSAKTPGSTRGGMDDGKPICLVEETHQEAKNINICYRLRSSPVSGSIP